MDGTIGTNGLEWPWMKIPLGMMIEMEIEIPKQEPQNRNSK